MKWEWYIESMPRSFKVAHMLEKYLLKPFTACSAADKPGAFRVNATYVDSKESKRELVS